MAYTKTTWVNGGAPALNATNLNKIEQGIADAHQLASGAVATVGPEWINLKARGMPSDGTDVSAFLAKEMAAAPTGARLYFGTGDFGFASPISPPNGKKLQFIGENNPSYSGGMHYMPAVFQTRLRVLSGFSGEGLFVMPADSRSMTFEQLLIAGCGIGSNVHGFRFPAFDTLSNGEQAVTMNRMHIAGFSGSGIVGRLWVFKMLSSIISANKGWGMSMDAETRGRMNDSKFFNNYWAFNETGNIRFAGNDGRNAGIEFIADRIERAGGNISNVHAPRNPSAPGVFIDRGSDIQFTNCFTDANTGPGVQLQMRAAGERGQLYRIKFTNCHFSRDGYGADTGTAPTNIGGIMAKGVGPTGNDRLAGPKFVNCTNSVGNPDDAGGFPNTQAPAYGIWAEHVDYLEWLSGKVEGHLKRLHLPTGSSAYRWHFNIPADGVLGIPSMDNTNAPHADYLAATGNDFALLYWNRSDNCLRVREGAMTYEFSSTASF